MNLYTCKHYFPSILIIAATLIPIAIGIYYAFNYHNPFVSNRGKLLRMACAFIVVGIFFLSLYLYAYFDNFNHIYAAKDSDQLKMIEGEISDLSTTDFLEFKYDSFRINGVEFSVSATSIDPGYQKPAAYGGVLKREGMRVRIAYIEYQKNRYIMSIDLLE